ncbi:hypothetical protein BY996DRAFT_6410435 [Phakopsora pachyrhizi]|nr:hypothetical protein BY996DRAFT_6410435 [Phakopsora pachyrhizi]
MSSTFSTTEYSENLGNNPLELLLLKLEARLEISPDQESFIQELAKLNTSANRHAAVVYLLMHNSHKMGLLGESISKLQGIYTSGGNLSQRDKMIGSQTFFWTKPSKERNLFKKKIMKNIIACEGNPEQPIPRLIELAKLLFEWAAPKGTSYSNKEIKEKFKDSKLCQRFYNIIFKLDNYISKKKVSDIDWEKIYPPTDLEVEEEIIRIENNSFSIINDNSGEE